jgi:hypothetical protein
METNTIRSNDTDHLANPAFKPSTLVHLLNFPKGSYCYPRTRPLPDGPHARKILLSQFTLIDTIPKIPDLMKQHNIYSGYDINVNFTKLNTLEIILKKLNYVEPSHKSNVSVISSKKYSNASDDEFELIKNTVKHIIGGTVPTDYSSFRSKRTYDGYAYIFADWAHDNVCEAALKNLKTRFSNFNINAIINVDGLYISCIKKDTNSPLPFALKETTTVKRSAPVSKDVSIRLPLKQLINVTIKSLMSKGMSFSSIQQTLGCSDAELIDMLDSSISSVNCDYVDILLALDN